MSRFKAQDISWPMAFCSPASVIRMPSMSIDRCGRFRLFKTKSGLRPGRPFMSCMSLAGSTSGSGEEKGEDIASIRTKSWVREIVVGLGLCPFAEPAMNSDTIRCVVSRVAHESMVRKVFFDEVALLLAAPPEQISTTLITMPEYAKDNFLRFHTLTSSIEEEISEDEVLADSVLIAAFHPNFRYEGMNENDALHFEKRAPYPIINILRAQQLDEYISQGKTHNIPKHNKQVLERIGSEQLKGLYYWE